MKLGTENVMSLFCLCVCVYVCETAMEFYLMTNGRNVYVL